MLTIMSMVIFAWLFVVGCCIGSFLNVVVYRLPLGKSLVRPGSHCPRCDHAIRWYHNLPIVGWLILRGRCFDCREPISIRYPLVEALVGAIFLVLALLMFARPHNPPPWSFLPTAASSWDWTWPRRLWVEYGSLSGLFCALLCGMLIRSDGRRVPQAVWAAAALFGAGLVLGLGWL